MTRYMGSVGGGARGHIGGARNGGGYEYGGGKFRRGSAMAIRGEEERGRKKWGCVLDPHGSSEVI